MSQSAVPVSASAAEIKQAVREHYAGRIRTTAQAANCCAPSGSACCAPSGNDCCSPQALYTESDLALAPAEAATHSFGCGNPTALANLQAGEVVLDLGSGGGLDVLLAAQRVGPSGFVYGVDMTDEMLALAQRNAAKAGVTHVAFLKGEIEAIPLPDASVDVIISNCVINLSPDKEAVLREAYRVLRPGGRLAISDIVVDGDLSDLPVREEQVRAALSWAGCIAGALSAQTYGSLLAAAGFKEANVAFTHRYSLAEFSPYVTEREGNSVLAGLADEVLAQLASRFTNSIVTAVRPAA